MGTSLKKVVVVEKRSRPGEMLKDQWLKRGWTLRQLGEKAGLSHTTISRIESVDRVRVGVETLGRIAAALRKTSDELMGTVRPTTKVPSILPFGPTVKIPLVNISLSAGQTVFGETRETPISVPVDLAQGHQLVAARVTGDGMEPEIHPGDVVIMDLSSRSPRPGRLVAVLLEDGGMAVKRCEVDASGPLLVVNRGRSYRPSQRVQGTLIKVIRDV